MKKKSENMMRTMFDGKLSVVASTRFVLIVGV